MTDSFQRNLAKYGLLDSEHRIYESKNKHENTTWFSSLTGTDEKGLMIPLGAWDDNDWSVLGVPSTQFSIPGEVYQSIGLKEKETCQGGVMKMTVFNDSETDFLTLRIGKWKVRESEKQYLKELNPESPFVTDDTLGTETTKLLKVGQNKNTAQLYQNVTSIPVPPKQLIVLDKSFLAPIYMKSATEANEKWAYGYRVDFDTDIQIKIEIHRKVYNVNTS